RARPGFPGDRRCGASARAATRAGCRSSGRSAGLQAAGRAARERAGRRAPSRPPSRGRSCRSAGGCGPRSRTPGDPSATERSLALEVAMDDGRRVAEPRKEPPELLREGDRPVTAAGAANRDGEVGLPFPPVAGQDELQEVLEAPEHLLALRMVQHEGTHALVAAVER